jgi:hypothetical protein
MGRLRIPFFVLAILVSAAIILIERRSVDPRTVAGFLPGFLTGRQPSSNFEQALAAFSPEQQRQLNALRQEKAGEISNLKQDFEGFGVEALQFVDVYLLFTMLIMSLGLILGEGIHAKVQGVITLIVGIVIIIVAIIKIFIILAKLLLMVGLLLAFPFGTLAYLIIYGDFDTGAAYAVMALLFVLKAVFGVLLVLAHQGFLKNIGLIVYTLLAFVGMIVVSFLYAIVPGFLVSITDAIAGIVLAIIGILLAIWMAIKALIAIVLAIKPI